MRLLDDLAQKPVKRHFCAHTIVDRGDPSPEPGKPIGNAPKDRHGPGWNRLHMPERVPVSEPVPELRLHPARRQIPAPKRNARRFYSPQDQSQIHPLFLLIDRASGQVLARVRGTLNHVEVEAEKFARAQGCELADLEILIEGATRGAPAILDQ